MSGSVSGIWNRSWSGSGYGSSCGSENRSGSGSGDMSGYERKNDGGFRGIVANVNEQIEIVVGTPAVDVGVKAGSEARVEA